MKACKDCDHAFVREDVHLKFQALECRRFPPSQNANPNYPNKAIAFPVVKLDYFCSEFLECKVKDANVVAMKPEAESEEKPKRKRTTHP